MCKSIKRLCICLLACSLWLAAGSGSTSQAEEMYQISESELTRLEVNLNQLAKNNETKQQLLNEEKIQIEMLNSQLEKANNQLEESKKEIQKSKTLNEATQKSLERANQALQQLEQEAARKVQVKARQRNLWIGATALMMYAYIKGK